MLIRYFLYSWTEVHDEHKVFQEYVRACLRNKHVYLRKCGVICGSLTLICSKSLSFSTLTVKLTILSRAVLALRIESSLVEGSHWLQRSTKLLNTPIYIIKAFIFQTHYLHAIQGFHNYFVS